MRILMLGASVVIRGIFVPVRRIVPMLACCYIILAVAGVGNVTGQKVEQVKKITGSSIRLFSVEEIPKASEGCAPAECEWWGQLRDTGNDLQRKPDTKSKRRFVTLFLLGLERAYRVPIRDRPSQALFIARPALLGHGLPKKNGIVSLSVEVRSDGSVGEVNVLKGLRSDMDESCVHAQRQSIFLPAVKDRVFVTDWQKAECRFWSLNGVN